MTLESRPNKPLPHYGALIWTYWATYRPSQVRQMEDFTGFVADLAETVSDEVLSIEDEIETKRRRERPDAGIPFLERVALSNMARKQAE